MKRRRCHRLDGWEVVCDVARSSAPLLRAVMWDGGRNGWWKARRCVEPHIIDSIRKEQKLWMKRKNERPGCNAGNRRNNIV